MSIQSIHSTKPIVHCITNYVVTNFTANGLLAVGASPIMADEIQEMHDIVQISNGLLINIGTLNTRTVDAMILAGQAANKKGVPVVLDPVGVGASKYRKQTVEQLLQHVQFTAIRCNAGELAALAEIKVTSRGVDAGEVSFEIEEAAKQVATRYKTIVAVSGVEDLITDGTTVHIINGGHAWMEQITGAGCLLSALTAASIASHTDALQSVITIHKDYKQVAETAHHHSNGIGDFQMHILNQLQQMSFGGIK